MTKPIPSFEYEQQYWQQGILYIAGVDEVGMGALAGPVVASAVIFSPPYEGGVLAEGEGRGLIRDSKLLSPLQRQKAVAYIKEHALAWAIAEASVKEIDLSNIRQASHLAMKKCLDTISVQIDIALIDGLPAQPHPTIPAVNIIKGDQKSYSIAAASILAKVYRDELMEALGEQYPTYGFAKHKGYGSKQHLDALQAHGASPVHRSSYAPVKAVLDKGPFLTKTASSSKLAST